METPKPILTAEQTWNLYVEDIYSGHIPFPNQRQQVKLAFLAGFSSGLAAVMTIISQHDLTDARRLLDNLTHEVRRLVTETTDPT